MCGIIMFDWRNFFREYLIPFISDGPNVAQNHIAINCPLCLGGDPSHHMGISLINGNWGCWRDDSHRGVSPHRLVMALLRCSFADAEAIVGDKRQVEIFNIKEIDKLLNGETQQQKILSLKLDSTFRALKNEGATKKFYYYMWKQRGFNLEDIDSVIRKYNLYCATQGVWSNRIVIPIYQHNKLVTWTGRTISNEEKIRYKTLSQNDSSPAIKRITDTLFNYDDVFKTGGTTLVVCEGPFDAIKIDKYIERTRLSDDGNNGANIFARATCLFGTGLSNTQKILLESLNKRFDEIVLLLDPEMISTAMRHAATLSCLNIKIAFLPAGIEDPGSMTPKEVANFALTL